MTPDDLQKMMINPFYAINIEPALAAPHEPMVPREQWIEANTRLMKEMGVKAWLDQLLNVLEGDYPRGSGQASR